MTSNPFVGTWRLRSMTSRAEDGTVTYPYGPDAAGYITYTDDGFMVTVGKYEVWRKIRGCH